MNLKDFTEGVTILRKYYDKPDGYHLAADTDSIHLVSTDTPMSREDIERMHDLGWNQDTCQAEFGEYDPDSGWFAYV